MLRWKPVRSAGKSSASFGALLRDARSPAAPFRYRLRAADSSSLRRSAAELLATRSQNRLLLLWRTTSYSQLPGPKVFLSSIKQWFSLPVDDGNSKETPPEEGRVRWVPLKLSYKKFYRVSPLGFCKKIVKHLTAYTAKIASKKCTRPLIHKALFAFKKSRGRK